MTSSDWVVKVMSASSHVARMNVPVCSVSLSTDDGKNTTFELDKETLQVMVEGLGKIRDQLSGI